jgi:hypothetical protein
MSQTRKRFNELKKQKRKQRKRAARMIECRGTHNGKPCGWGLYPRKDDIDSVFTCHRCHTIMIMTVHGWRTLKEAQKSRIYAQEGDEQWVR